MQFTIRSTCQAVIKLVFVLGLMEFDSLKSSEVNQFRGKMKALADQMQADRRRKSWLDRLLYQFAPRLAASTLSSNVLPATVTRRLRDDNFSVVIKFDNTEVCVPIMSILSLKHLVFFLYITLFRLRSRLMLVLRQRPIN